MAEDHDVPREQVETALQFLEWSHGDALRRPWSDEAHAYYQAIDILEAALDEELLPPDEIHTTMQEGDCIRRSRSAREEGYAAATLLNERFEDHTDRPTGLVEKIRQFFTA